MVVWVCTRRASGCLKTHIHLLKNAKEPNSTTKWNFLTWVLTSESAASRTVGKMLFCVIHSLSHVRLSWVAVFWGLVMLICMWKGRKRRFDGLERNAVQKTLHFVFLRSVPFLFFCMKFLIDYSVVLSVFCLFQKSFGRFESRRISQKTHSWEYF